jgi:hypothetical protein
MKIVLSAMCVAALAGSAMAQSGSGIQAQAATAGAPLLAVQANPTQFGNSSGTQGSNGGSELNAAWGTISGGRLKLFTTGNLEGNFNKLWFFMDSGAGGVSQLAGGYSDGGFNEINNMTGLTFDSGFTPERGIRLEVGGGFFGVRGFTLNGAPGFDIATGPGIGALPLGNVAGAAGVNFGWDNSNTLGVDGGSAAGALTADSGWAFDIDLAAYFGDASISEVRVMAFITSGDAGFASNQFLGSLPQGFGNLGNLGNTNLGNFDGNQYFTVVPAPGAFALLGLGGLIAGRRRRA